MLTFILGLGAVSLGLVLYGGHKALDEDDDGEDRLSGLPMIAAGLIGLVLDAIVAVIWTFT